MNRKVLFWVGGGVVLLIVVMLFLTVFSTSRYTMRGQSMQPTIVDGQGVGLNTFRTDYRRGDIVVISLATGERIIKRIVGLPGEKVEIKNGKIYIDTVFLAEPYVTGPTVPDLNVELKRDEYFVMGDNRPHSIDSRNFGPVSKDTLLGTARVLSK